MVVVRLVGHGKKLNWLDIVGQRKVGVLMGGWLSWLNNDWLGGWMIRIVDGSTGR